jgi:hypothetical protein
MLVWHNHRAPTWFCKSYILKLQQNYGALVQPWFRQTHCDTKKALGHLCWHKITKTLIKFVPRLLFVTHITTLSWWYQKCIWNKVDNILWSTNTRCVPACPGVEHVLVSNHQQNDYIELWYFFKSLSVHWIIIFFSNYYQCRHVKVLDSVLYPVFMLCLCFIDSIRDTFDDRSKIYESNKYFTILEIM